MFNSIYCFLRLLIVFQFQDEAKIIIKDQQFTTTESENEFKSDLQEETQNKTKKYGRTRSYYNCKYCSYKSDKKTNLVVHERIHTKTKPHKCRFCDYEAVRKPDVTTHERKHTGSRPFKCEQCQYSAARSGTLATHMLTHLKEKQFKCRYCPFKTSKKYDYVIHESKHDSSENPYVTHSQIIFSLNKKPENNCGKVKCKSDYDKRRKMKCKFCNFETVVFKTLIMHEKSHSNHSDEKKFSCAYCTFSSNDFDVVYDHERNHTEDDIF